MSFLSVNAPLLEPNLNSIELFNVIRNGSVDLSKGGNAMKTVIRGALLVGTALSFMPPAFAQGTQVASAQIVQGVGADQGDQLEEIVVTAEKRKQSLQSVPMSISAISTATLQDSGTITMQGIANMVPSLNTVQNISPMNQSYRIRGIGSDPNIPTFEPDVALFIDGVYMPRSGLGVDDLVDVSRVEVLKGPQSTLYGKNATAGVINVVTAPPSDQFHAHVEGSLSNIEGGENALVGRIAGSITGPLAEGVRGRLTGVYYDQGHTFRNLDAGAGDANNLKRYALRGQIEFDLSGNTVLNLTAAHTQVLHSDLTNPDVYLGDPALHEAGTLADMIDNPADPFHALSAYFPNAKGCPDTNPTNRVICTTEPNHYRGWTNMASATLTSTFDFATLTSITAWSDYMSRTDASDIDQVSLPLVGFSDTQRGDSFSQELRLASPAGQTFEWLAGGYYLHTGFNRGDHGRTPTFTLEGAAPFVPMPLPPAMQAQLAPLFGGLAQLGSYGLLTNPLTGGALGIPAQIAGQLTLGQNGDRGYLNSDATSDYYAIFGQGTMHFNRQLALTGGLRWQSEDKTASLDNRTAAAANPYFAGLVSQLTSPANSTLLPAMLGTSLYNQLVAGATQLTGTNLLTGKLTPAFVNGALPKQSKSVVTWSATASYTPAEGALFYATLARGFKSGGENIGFGNAPVSSLAYKPETVNDVEIGTKLDLLDNKARIALSLFQTTYHNYQNAGFVGLQFLVNNAEEARVRGVEFDGAFLLAHGLTLNAGATYLDARFVKYTGGACAFGQTPDANGACDQSGKSLPLTPAWRLTSGLQYDRDAGIGDAYGRIDVSWQSKTTTNSANLDPRSVQGAYALVNLRTGIRLDSGFDISVWADNVFDENYIQQAAVLDLFSANPNGTTTSGYQVFMGAPRQIGITIRKDF